MAQRRVLVLVLAGGAGGRLELLTEERAKPAVPFAGTHRLIDFPLSNSLNSGLRDVWVSQQFNAHSLSQHLANGRPWDLDRTVGGLLFLQPRLGNDDRAGFNQGTADTLWRAAPMIREFAPEALVVLSADAIYTADYATLVEEHLSSDAAVTIVTTEVDPGDAGRYGVVQVSGNGKVDDYVYKPDEPASNVVANEIFVFRPDTALDALEELAGQVGEDGLEDLGHHLLPRLVQEGKAHEHRHEGYWRDVGTVASYHQSHLELLDDQPPIDLDDPAWPILTRAAAHRAPARVLRGAEVDRSLLAPASQIAGSVERSVIGRGSVVEAGAVVRESVLLPGAVVRRGAVVESAILDDGVEVGPEARVGRLGAEPALLALRVHVDAGAQVDAGARLPER